MTTNSLQNSPLWWVLFPIPLVWLAFVTGFDQSVLGDTFWGLGLQSHCDFCFTLLELGVHTMKKSEMISPYICPPFTGPSWTQAPGNLSWIQWLSKTRLALPSQPCRIAEQIMNHCCLMPLCFEVVCSTVIDNWTMRYISGFPFFFFWYAKLLNFLYTSSSVNVEKHLQFVCACGPFSFHLF